MAPSLRWRSGVGPDAPGYWWCRMRLLYVDFDGRDESLYCGDWTPVLCEAFGNPMEVRVISGRGSWTFPVIQWIWDRLRGALPSLHAVTVLETCTSGCTYFGDTSDHA